MTQMTTTNQQPRERQETKMTTTKTRKPCERCERMPATRRGLCAQCRRELAKIGAATTTEDVHKLVAALEICNAEI